MVHASTGKTRPVEIRSHYSEVHPSLKMAFILNSKFVFVLSGILILTLTLTSLVLIYSNNHNLYSNAGIHFEGTGIEYDDFPTSKTTNSYSDINLLDQTDKTLWSYVRENHIFEPSTLEYSFGKAAVGKIEPDVDNVVIPLFKNKKRGIFIEVGAFDGMYSHTLYLERYFLWTGLLIECNPFLLPKLKSVHRKAYIADVCLSSDTRARRANMTSMDSWLASSSLGRGDIFPHYKAQKFTTVQVQTIPLFTIMAAVDIKVVDFLVLDIQSMELHVLRAFPFHLVTVKVWLIEKDLFTKNEKEEMKTLMKNNGYSKVVELNYDYVFVHNSLI